GNEDELLRRKVEASDACLRIDVEVEVAQGVARPSKAGGDVDEAETAGRRTQADILGNAEVSNDVDLLRNQSHAPTLRSRNARRAVGHIGKRHRAGIAAGRVDAGEDLDEGRLAGAVLPEEGHDLPRRNRETDVVEGKHAGKALGEI